MSKLTKATAGIPNFKLYMLKFYNDDCNILCESLPLGARLCTDGIIRVIEDQIETDKTIPKDMRCAKIFQEIAGRRNVVRCACL